MNIDVNRIKIDFNNNQCEIMAPTDLKIEYERFNESPVIKDSYMTAGFDFMDLKINDSLKISAPTSIELSFKQHIFTYLMRCIDLNINYQDGLERYFQLYIWNSENIMG